MSNSVITQRLQQRGWTGWVAPATREFPQVGYTIGLTRQQIPEVIVVGDYHRTVTAKIIEIIGTSLTSHKLLIGDGSVAQIESAGLNVSGMFREVTPACAVRCAPLIAEHCATNFRLLQFIIPDHRQRYPWHPYCMPRFKAQMALQYAARMLH